MSVERLSASLEGKVRQTLRDTPWVEGTDQATVELAATYARRIDQATAEFESGEISSSDYTKVLYLGPHLLNTLKALGGSPEERQKLLAGRGEEKEVDPVDDLLKQRRKRAAG